MNYVENALIFWGLAFFFFAVIHIVHTIYKNKTKMVDTSGEVFKHMHDAMIKAKKDNLKPLRSEANYLDELNNQSEDLKKAIEDGVGTPLGLPLLAAKIPEFDDKMGKPKSILSELRDNAANPMLTNDTLPPSSFVHITGKMDVKIKKLHKNAVIPSYSKAGDAGMDLTAVTKEFEVNEAGQKLLVYDTGLAVEIPAGYVGLVFPRSSISKTGLIMTNHVGVIDSGYRGTIKQKFRVDGRPTKKSSYNVGDRVAQMIIVPYPAINFVESDELSSTERGTGGYGSSGK